MGWISRIARQWLLLGRRHEYAPGTGVHELWLSAGGSAGHSSLWAPEIREGQQTGPCGRSWIVNVNSVADAKEVKTLQKQKVRMDAAIARIKESMSSAPNCTETKSKIEEQSGVQRELLEQALSSMLVSGVVVETSVQKANGQFYEAFQLVAPT